MIWLASPATGNGANNNTIKNCIIEGNSATTTFTGVHIGGNSSIGITTAGAELNNNNTISNNLFRKTQYGATLFGFASASPDQNNVISNNNFGTAVPGEGHSLLAINANRQSNLVVSGNEVQNVVNATNTTSTAIGGIRLLDFKNGLCFNNKIHDLAYTGTSTPKIYGIAMTNSSYTTAGNPSNAQIYNNIVYRVNSTATSSIWNLTGILTSAGYGDKIYYNSVHLTGQLANHSSGLAAAFANGDANITSVGTNIEVRNNSFSITGSNGASGGNFWAYYTTATSLTGSILSNNNLHCAGTNVSANNVGRFNGINYTTLAAWQTATLQDANSISTDPKYNGVNNLVPQIESPLLNAGTPLTITTDISGFVRSTTTPTIGAYEQAGDLAAPAISYTTLSFTCATGDRTLAGVTISDATGVPTTGSLQPRVYYRKNTGTWFSRQGILASGSGLNGTWNFTIVAADMGGLNVGDVVQYYVIAQDLAAIPRIGSNPEAGLSATDVNTVTAPPTTPNSYSISNTLNGTYTVGASGNFTTLTAAISSYNTACLTGPVIFELPGATYSAGEIFPLQINANASASSVNTLTIRPAAGVAATVTGSSSAIFKLNGADYVIIDGSNSGGSDRSLTIQNTTTSTSGNAVIWLASPIIEGNSATTTFTGVHIGGNSSIGIITAGAELNNNNTISNNLFRKTQYGATLFGFAAASPDQNNVISNNNFGTAVPGEGHSLLAINADRQLGLVVSGNEVQNVVNNTNTTSTPFGGIRLLDFKNGRCFNNKVHDLAYTGTSTAKIYGIAMTNSSYTTAGNQSNAWIYNNIVYRINSTAASSLWNLTGILASAGYGDRIYYNSVHLTGQLANNSSGLAAAFANGDANITSVGTNIDVRNNSFSITGSNGTSGGNFWAYYTGATTLNGSVLMNNNLYCAGTNVAANNVGRFNGTNYTTLAAWQAATAQNANSIATDPKYNGVNNLAPQMGSPLLNAGMPLIITTDITGFIRNTTTPTIGAYEQADDQVAPVITYTTLAFTCATGDRTLTGVTISDATGVPTTGSLQPRVYYRKNTGTWFSRQGMLASGSGLNGTWNFAIVAADMGGLNVGDIVQYYVIAQDLAANPNIGSNPAEGLVATDVNTVTTPPATPNSYSISNTLSGTYTVGAGGNYTTLTAALTSYNSACLSGPVVFELLDTDYSAGETFPLQINANATASSVNTLTIRPATGVAAMVTGSSSAIFKLNGADYVIIDGINSGGRSLTLSNTNTASGTSVVWIGSLGAAAGATNDTLRNCTILNGTLGSATVVNYGVFIGQASGATNGEDNDNIAITGNTIRKCGIGIQAIGGATAGQQNDNMLIDNNIIGDTVATNSIGRYGMNLGQSTNATVSRNTIQNVITSDAANSSNNNATGIIIGMGTSNSLITRNNITGVKYTGTGGFGGKGVDINTGNASSNVTLSNNFVSDIGGDGWSSLTADAIIGIRITGTSGGFKLYHNTVNLSGTFAGNSNGTQSAALFINSAVTALDIRNNILVTSLDNSNTISDKTWALYSAAAKTAFTSINYNDYSVSGAAGVLGFLGADLLALANIQTATAQDANSISVAPVFISATDLHLVPGSNCGLHRRGTPIATVSVDIDNETRSATNPDMGADEYANSTTGTITWTGAVSTNWFDVRNWSVCEIPGPTSNVVINSGMPNYPNVSASVTINRLTLNTGSSMTVATGVILTLLSL